jgi:asparagine synthase (glutamine-hydrolysing)
VNAFVAEVARGDGPVRATGIADPRSAPWIVGHVRLDAREGLRDALGAAGIPTARGATDADLVLAAWMAWRETATERLRGDFSFAIWDSRERVLFCARDALGVRPLYWAAVGGTFVCSSDLDAVRAHKAVSSRLHKPAIMSFLGVGYNVDCGTTSFADIQRLPPAHQLVVRADWTSIVPRRYWDFPVPEPLRLSREQDYAERFRDVLGDAVRDRLRGDRAAILLSGGLDSTSLAATARRVAPDVLLGAWTNDMGESAPEDEVMLAGAVAQQLGISHEIVCNKIEPLAHLRSRGFRSPEPVDEPEWGSWRRQLKRISSSAPTLVMGEDGDALLRPPGLLAMLRAWPASDVLRRILSYTVEHRHHPHLGIWLRRGFRAPHKSAHPTRPAAVSYLRDPMWQSVLEQAQPAYTGVPLQMVWPLLDTRVIEFVFSVPPVPWCQKKELLRRAFRDDLPAPVIARPKSPLRGFYERQVHEWRAMRASSEFTLSERVREFVDSRSVAHTLHEGSVWDTIAAWRVLIVDQWLAGV